MHSCLSSGFFNVGSEYCKIIRSSDENPILARQSPGQSGVKKIDRTKTVCARRTVSLLQPKEAPLNELDVEQVDAGVDPGHGFDFHGSLQPPAHPVIGRILLRFTDADKAVKKCSKT